MDKQLLIKKKKKKDKQLGSSILSEKLLVYGETINRMRIKEGIYGN